MYFPEQGLLFVHVPKTGGRSVEHALVEAFGASWDDAEKHVVGLNVDPAKGPPVKEHLTAREYVDKGWIDAASYAAAKKFAVVRNPFDRMVSQWRFRHSDKSFEEFLTNGFPKPEDDRYGTAFDMYRNVVPQARFIYGADGLGSVDVIHFENIEKEFRSLMKRYGVRVPELSERNASRDAGDDFRKYYDERTRRIVAEMYAEDFERFGYSK